MGRKGDKAQLAPIAKRLFSEGHSRAEIARRLDVSDTTIDRWYRDADIPSGGNQWEEGRARHRSYSDRISELFDRELEAAEEAKAGTLSAPTLDAIQKLSSMALKFRELEQRSGEITFDRPKVFLENVQFIAGWLREHDPEGLKVLAKNFDALMIAFKAENEKA